jgi:hypothetical protein
MPLQAKPVGHRPRPRRPFRPGRQQRLDQRPQVVVHDPRPRTRAAVERTVPFGLYCYTITVAWYALHGHQPGDVAEHRQRAPWYTTKTDPSLSDMIAKLRRVIIAARCMPTRPGQPTEQEIRTVQQAWAAASTNAAA